MKRGVLIIIFFMFFGEASANHLKGGWMYYEYLGISLNDPTKLRYKLVLKQYMVCDANNDQTDNSINFTIFNATDNSFIQNATAPINSEENIQNHPNNPCIQNEPSICYKIITYETIVELTATPNGYIIAKQRCCRIAGIRNISNSDDVGATYMMKIPGTALGFDAEKNNSAVFAQKDTITICANSYFEFPFDCTDVDGDSLSYSFCDALIGGSMGNPQPLTASSPPYNAVPYAPSFNGLQPLGNPVTINEETGLVSGIAPSIGIYVIAICCSEYRNGVKINEVRKELHISIENCVPLQATLDPEYITCDGFTLSFSNKSFIDANSTYEWEFGDPNSGVGNTSSLSNPTHTFSAAGDYIISLKVSLNGLCENSTQAVVKVYPGFFPDFNAPTSSCKGAAIQFTDNTATNFGIVNSWSWNFNDLNDPQDKSNLQSPAYAFNNLGPHNVSLIVSNSKGCVDTVIKAINIYDKPPLSLTNDTLICSIDDLQLTATGNGNIIWSPNYNINNTNSFTPVVSPDEPTTYHAILTDAFGCFAEGSVHVDVRSFVTLNAGNDTTICQTDNFMIPATGDALHYKWSPAIGLSNDIIKNPLATPLNTTLYHLTGNIGSCISEDDILITVIPYPVAKAGKDTSICFGTNAQLNASGGSNYVWAPSTFLSNPQISNPIVINPTNTIEYVVTVTDILGCPKPVNDTVFVNVTKVNANAGPSDTTIVEDQILQLNATGGVIYLWTPDTWLNNPNISNPTSSPQDDIKYGLLVKSLEGCEGKDSIRIKLFKVKADIYVPNAFTPNRDGLNDIIKPILLGIKELKYFRVYNRWGQLVFSTSQQGKGWDGILAGKPQESGTYIWMAEGITYKNTITKQKGYVLLIR